MAAPLVTVAVMSVSPMSNATWWPAVFVSASAAGSNATMALVVSVAVAVTVTVETSFSTEAV